MTEYVSYRLTLPENKELIFKFRELKNKINHIEGLESYHYKLTSTLHTMIIIVKDDNNPYLHNYAEDCFKKIGKNYTRLFISDMDLSKLKNLK